MQGDLEEGSAGAAAGGEDGALVSETRKGAVEGAGEREPAPVRDEFDAAVDDELDAIFGAAEPGAEGPPTIFPRTAEEFFGQVEKKLIDLLSQAEDAQFEIAQAIRRLDQANLLGAKPNPKGSLCQAAFDLIGNNPHFLHWTDDWRDIGMKGYWEAAETPEELITQLLPSGITLS